MDVKGRIDWGLETTQEGHRTYSIDWLCVGELNEGPQTASLAAGLPVVGAAWAYGGDNDPYALCTPEISCRPVLTDQPGKWWRVGQKFTTPGGKDGKPRTRCQDETIEDPLMEPPKLKGTFVKYTREATEDRNGDKLKSSSHEMFRGAAVEVDDNRPTVSISLNLATLPIGTFGPMVDTVNSGSLWGVGARKVKLSGVSWERFVYGICNFYYTVTYDFDIRDDAMGFDRKIVDEGYKVLNVGGDVNNPEDFIVYKDINGENTRVLLDGAGNALGDATTPFAFEFELYDESDFLTLGIPASL